MNKASPFVAIWHPNSMDDLIDRRSLDILIAHLQQIHEIMNHNALEYLEILPTPNDDPYGFQTTYDYWLIVDPNEYKLFTEKTTLYYENIIEEIYNLWDLFGTIYLIDDSSKMHYTEKYGLVYQEYFR
jgi:hypothetical protein